MNNPSQQNSKNGNVASATNGGQQENIDLLKVISHKNFIQLQRTTEDTIGPQFNPAGNVVDLNVDDVFKLLKENLNFKPMQKYFNKTKFLTT